MTRLWFITGTDTSVGKTVLAVWLTTALRSHGQRTLAVKPFSSGDRDDAQRLFEAQDGLVPLDEINPWHFPIPLAPLVAARQRGQTPSLNRTLTFLTQASQGVDHLIIEGAGGLLSPLGEGFSARELIHRLRATPIVVAPNRLGAINQARLVQAALPKFAAAKAQLVLMEQARPDLSANSNVTVLKEFFGIGRVHRLPWHPEGAKARVSPGLKKRLLRIIA